MSNINFSTTTPAAPAGGTNIHWQTDGSGGNISGYLAKGVVAIRNTAVNTTMTSADYTVVATAPSITITLPVSPVLGQLANIKNANPTVGQTITVTAGGTILIDGGVTVTVGATASLHVQWDGAQWWIL